VNRYLETGFSFLAGLLALVLAWPAAGADSEITIENTAIRQMLMDQLFVDRGRYHLLRQSPCQFAYLESPVVAVAVGRVGIKARLTGLLGMEGAGGCSGAGESFDVTVSGKPYFSGGYLGLTDIRVDEVSNELYRIVLQNFLAQALPQALEINLRQGLQQLIADQKSSYQVSVSKLLVSNLTAENNRIHANLSFVLLAR
jgi:hypothetical protein